MLTAGDSRHRIDNVRGSGIEKADRAARRLQKIAIDEPSADGRPVLAGLRSRHEEHHHVRYTDAALEVAVSWRRGTARLPPPDSAIDPIDEAGAATRLSAPPPSPPATSGLISASRVFPCPPLPALLTVTPPAASSARVAPDARTPAAHPSDRERLRTLGTAPARGLSVA